MAAPVIQWAVNLNQNRSFQDLQAFKMLTVVVWRSCDGSYPISLDRQSLLIAKQLWIMRKQLEKPSKLNHVKFAEKLAVNLSHFVSRLFVSWLHQSEILAGRLSKIKPASAREFHKKTWPFFHSPQQHIKVVCIEEINWPDVYETAINIFGDSLTSGIAAHFS